MMENTEITVVDSRARTNADGNLQQQARRKLEVFQSQVPGGRIQVIKSRTSVSSSSRWSSTNFSSNAIVSDPIDRIAGEFEDLKLSFNPLDLTSEKSKARVGRSVGRRPPSRSHIRSHTDNLHTTAAVNLHRVSRLCHQIHNSALKQTFGTFGSDSTDSTLEAALEEKRSSGDGIEITEIEEPRPLLSRTKSTSSEDLAESKKSLEDLNDLEQLQNWRRTSKVRRSLQYTNKRNEHHSKPPDLPIVAGSVRKIREDLETGRRLNTALRGNSTVDLEALDNILKSISNSSISSASVNNEEVEIKAKKSSATQKRNSFVTVESIQAVRDRLKRPNSPSLTLNQEVESKLDDDKDDGFDSDKPVTLSQITDMNHQKVRSFVSGFEGKRTGTGSLESKSKIGVNCNKNEDWYARRKSYGFEQMQHQNPEENSMTKNRRSDNYRIESSTDSGICRSTEIVVIPTSQKDPDFEGFKSNDFDLNVNTGNVKKFAKIFESQSKKENLFGNKPIKANGQSKRHSIAVDDCKIQQNDTFKDTFKDSTNANENFDESNKGNNNSNKANSGKKVEFCKTEVHFAADSGRVNIVQTDEKPPPTQNFRRRRRNSGPYAELLANNCSNGLPVLHFGDTTYEKSLFGDRQSTEKENSYENLNYDTHFNGNTVTVNAPQNGFQQQDNEGFKDFNDTEAPRGILKNKPVKPKPYLLGINKENEWEEWEHETPIWNSTVTLRNNLYNNQTSTKDSKDTKEEFQKLLTQLRPATSHPSPQLFKRKSEGNFDHFQVSPPTPPNRRSSWSVADRIKQVEDFHWNTNKGYSTKVNFGNGEATVVENLHSRWPKNEDPTEGRNEKHTVCSKTMTNSDTNETMTTTKITIDLTPSPTTTTNDDFKFPSQRAADPFKSPSLIMKLESGHKLPQLEALRKLYDDAVHSDSEADKEVHRILMNSERDNDRNSILSGSWSKMTAFKHINNNHASINNESTAKTNGSHALELKIGSSPKLVSPKPTKYKNSNEDNVKSISSRYNAQFGGTKKIFDDHCKLSSPFLVGQSRSRANSYNSDIDHSDRPTVTTNFKRKSPHSQILRQPKKSEMAYFGVPVAESPKKRDDTPDLLQFNPKSLNSDLKASSIYENDKSIHSAYNRNVQNKFDSSILDELTKAADQILEAVNNYENDSKMRDDEYLMKTQEKLDTISETNAWKKTKATNSSPNKGFTSNKLKSTSSNSSLDSISKECRRSGNERPFMTKSCEQKQRKKVVTSNETNIKSSTTKARRLQRASSRDALLQSHGSSSEDLASNQVPEVRKPTRLIKRTKTTELTVTNGLDLKKMPAKKLKDEKKHPERVTSALPEIRHKTAISTIRSTAEKAAASKQRSKNEEVKRRQLFNGSITTSSTNSKGTSSTRRTKS